MEDTKIEYFFKKPHQVPSEILDQIKNLIKKGGEVGTAYIDENLRNAFLIGYAMHQEKVVGTSTHKHPLGEYRQKIEAATSLDLSEYLERGYTSVDPAYRGHEIGDRLLKGLIKRSQGKKIYVTIRMGNIPPIKLTYKNQMSLAATFIHHKTGHKVGVFTNQKPSPIIS